MNESIKNSSIYKYIWKSKNVSKYFLRFILRTLLITLLASILGAPFILIALGIIFSLIRLAFIWRPAFMLFAKMVSFEEKEFIFKPAQIHGWRAFYWVFRIVITGLTFIGGGVWLLFKNGFYTQNFIC